MKKQSVIQEFQCYNCGNIETIKIIGKFDIKEFRCPFCQKKGGFKPFNEDNVDGIKDVHFTLPFSGR